MIRNERARAFWPGWVTVIACAMSAGLAAQAPSSVDRDALRTRVLEMFEVVPLQGGDGLALVPREPTGDVRLIEVRGGTIAVNGQVVSGSELEAQVPAVAPLLVQLSYLGPEAQSLLLDEIEQEADIAAPPEPPTPASPDLPRDVDAERDARTPAPSRRRTRRSGAIVRVADSVTVDADERVTGDVVVIAGDVRIDGLVTGDVVVVAGFLDLGDEAEVNGDLVSIGSRMRRAPGARVDGEFVNVAIGNPFLEGGPFNDMFWRGPFWGRQGPAFPRMLGLLGTLMRIGLILIFAWLALTLARGPVDRIAERASAEPLKAGLVGVLVELLFVPSLVIVSLLLAVSIVGIPLLVLIPVTVLLLLIVLHAGFAAVAMRVGQWLAGRLGHEPIGGYAAIAIGTLFVLSLWIFVRFLSLAGGVMLSLGLLVSVLAFCVEYVAWTVGLGAAVLVRLAPRTMPPAADL